MKSNPTFDQLFESWIETKREILKRRGPLPFGPEIIEPGVGNQRYMDAITPTVISIREVSETSPSRNKTFRFAISEIRREFKQMYEDRSVLATKPRALCYKYKSQNRIIKLLIEFKFDMFRDFMGL